jgi:serine/threonine protein kinase
VHNDIKPDNITIGHGSENRFTDGRARLVDYGLCQQYHLATENEPFFKGNEMLASADRMQLKPPSRRDDLFSLLLIVTYLLKDLPFSKIYFDSTYSKKKKFQKILNRKLHLKARDYCKS